MTIVEMILSLILGTVLLASAVPKLRRPKSFVLTVLEYRILPPFLGRLYARLLPPVELLVALLLLSGTALRIAAVLASLLLASFIAAIGINLARGRELDCGCFGQGRDRRIGRGLLAQDLGLLTASAVVTAVSDGRLGLAAWSPFSLAGGPLGQTLGALATCTAMTGSVSLGLPAIRSLRAKGRAGATRYELPRDRTAGGTSP